MIKKFSISHFFWDLWCLVSVIGIWPRFIEPNLLKVNKFNLYSPKINKDNSLKILQFSDLHFNKHLSDRFLSRLQKKILNQNPDLIVFTGDFLSYSKLDDKERLKNFLNSLQAKYGCFATFGNHDYEKFASINIDGEYDVIEDQSSTIIKGFKRLFSTIHLQNKTTKRASDIKHHEELKELLKETPFKVLDNQHEKIAFNNSFLNLVGLGEYTLKKCLPENCFDKVNSDYPTLILSHNPDSLSILKKYPHDLILSGHTHGGQIYFPGFKEKFTLMEDPELIRGFIKKENGKIYINRGIGSVMKFRFLSIPEITVITLKYGCQNEFN